MSFEFVIPAARTIDIAKRLQSLVFALLSASKVSRRASDDFRQAVENDSGCDLTFYFNHDFGDAVEIAKHFLESPDQELRDVAKVVLDQAEACAKSRASLLDDVRRLHGDEVADKVGRGEWSPGGPESSSSSLESTNESRDATGGTPIDSDDSSIRRPR